MLSSKSYKYTFLRLSAQRRFVGPDIRKLMNGEIFDTKVEDIER